MLFISFPEIILFCGLLAVSLIAIGFFIYALGKKAGRNEKEVEKGMNTTKP